MGWIFFVKKLFKDYELRHHMVQLIFCINFTLSCTMFELIIFEIIDHMERSSRYFHWIFSLYVMLFMIIILTPFYIFYNVLSNVHQIPAHWLSPLCFVTWIVYIVVFWKIGDPFPIHNSKVRNLILIKAEILCFNYNPSYSYLAENELTSKFSLSMAYYLLKHVLAELGLLV